MMKPLLHNLSAQQLEAAWRDPAGGYIFHGIRSMGKATAARELARRFNCQGDEDRLCAPCRQFASGSYPDFIEVRPEGRASITIEQVRQLGHALSLSSYYAQGMRVVLIDEAQTLTLEAQNALLKLIEEPPPRTLFVLATEQLEALLATVCSRLVAVYFAPVTSAAVAEYLTAEHEVAPAEAERIAELAGGAPGLAVQLAHDVAVAEQLGALDGAARTVLAASCFDRLVLAKQLMEQKVDLSVLAARLQRTLVLGLRRGERGASEAARQLVAVELFRRGLVANLGQRVALERLMLEL